MKTRYGAHNLAQSMQRLRTKSRMATRHSFASKIICFLCVTWLLLHHVNDSAFSVSRWSPEVIQVLNLMWNVRKDETDFDIYNCGRDGDKKRGKILVKLIKPTKGNNRIKREWLIFFSVAVTFIAHRTWQEAKGSVSFVSFISLETTIAKINTCMMGLLNGLCQSVRFLQQKHQELTRLCIVCVLVMGTMCADLLSSSWNRKT